MRCFLWVVKGEVHLVSVVTIDVESGMTKICDKEECNENGEYKAPKSRIKLNEYYYFCLKLNISFQPTGRDKIESEIVP